MKKFLITIALLLLIGTGYLTYEKWVRHANLTYWSFIPADATMVIELEVTEDINELQQYPIWNTVERSTGFANLKHGISFLDSINGEGGFSAIFKKVPLLISMHKVSNSNIDFLFVTELQNISQNTFVHAAIGRIKKQGYRFKTRNYHDFKISEISHQGKILTFIFFKNYFLASFTPYLVEDAIRVISESDFVSFREKFTQFKDPGLQGIASIYLNYEKVGETIGAFAQRDMLLPLISGNYDWLVDSLFIQFSGFSYAQDGWIATHTSQPAPFDMKEVVPENTAYFYHITSSDLPEWKENQINYLRTTDPDIKKYQDSLKQYYDFHAEQVFDLIANEIGIANLESPRTRDEIKLVMLEMKDIKESMDFFNQAAQRISIARGDSIYTEAYSDNEIRFFPVAQFPSILLGHLATGFDQCFYISYRNYLIISNDLQALKTLISSISNEDTWGKSIQMNNFLQRANNAANVSLIVNIPRAWNKLLTKLKPEWQDHFKQNQNVYKSIELAAFQFSYLEGRYFTNYTLTQPARKKKSIPKTSPTNGVQFAEKIITKPYLLRSHAHRNFDIMVQDSSNTVYYLDPNQNTLWSRPLEGSIISHVFPIDYYKNGKLQYLFATTTQVHIIDRTGEYIPGYPKPLPGKPSIDHLNLIDYDLSRNYRIAITDDRGRVFLTDKDLKTLDGWNPRDLNRKALVPLHHARLGKKDIMISIQENGVINLMNRRGGFLKGFPFDTKQSLSAQYYLRPSNTLGNSSLTVLSTGGELTEITLEGDVIRRDQLIKTTADATFRLITDTGKDAFIIIRKEGNTYEVLDDTGNLLFKKDYLSEGPILTQFYQFGAGKDLIIFTDTANHSLYIYDKSGNLLTGNPLNSTHEVGVIHSSAKRTFEVFSTWDFILELYSFSY